MSRSALVTGGGRGIGAATCQLLARDGWSVGVFDRDEVAAKAVAEGISGAGGQAVALFGDVAVSADVQAGVSACVTAFGGLDAAAGVAGILRHATVPDCEESMWDEVQATNTKGCFLLGKYAIPELRRRGGGSIVFASSVMAQAATAGAAAYCASKAAIVGLCTAMALDHAAESIRVNCVAPASVRTPMLVAAATAAGASDPHGEVESWGLGHPIGRIIEPEEVAELICFLLSDRAKAITGSVHRVDGGLLAKLAV